MVNRSQMCWKRKSQLLILSLSIATVSETAAAQQDGLYDKKIMASQPGSFRSASGQLSKQISVSFSDTDVHVALKQIAAKAGIDLTYENSAFSGKSKISLRLTNVSTEQALRKVCELAGVSVDVYGTSGNRVNLKPKTATSNQSQATGSISGKVIDSVSGKAIAGVLVNLNGTKMAATTDSRGSFVFSSVLKGEAKLSFKMIGYRAAAQTVDVQPDKTTSVSVTLAPSATALSGVVTTATGVQRRVEVASDIVKIDGDKMRERAPVRSLTDMIEAAQINGVVVTRASGDPGAPARIRMRGVGSISESNDPVMIVDGVWVDITMASPSKLDDLDPASIESIEIVRGPSAATLYGQDASNGVILVTTKRGKAGPTRYNFSYNRDWGSTHGTLPLQYRGVGRRPRTTIQSACSVAQVVSYECVQDTVYVFDPNHEWISREGQESNEKFSLQMDGGAPAVTYSLTVSTGKTIGVRRVSEIDRIRFRIMDYASESKFNRPSELRRNNFSANLSFNPRQNLSIGTTISAVQSGLKDSYYENSWNMVTSPAIGSHKLSLDTVFDTRISFPSDIQAWEKPVSTTTGTLSANIQYRPLNKYVLNTTFGAERMAKFESHYGRKTRCRITLGCADTLGNRAERSENSDVYTIRTNASTTLDLGALSNIIDIRPSVGGDFRRTGKNYLAIQKSNVPVGDKSIAQGTGSNSSASLDNATAGWFLNSTIGIFRRAYFDVGIRQDIGSAIASSNDAIYPKLGGSWLISDEGFWRENRIISSLRLRSALGHSAVQPNLADKYGKFINAMEYIEGKWIPVAEHSSIGNSRIRPERAVEVEVGFDIDALGDRLNIVTTFARKQNRNTLVTRSLPPSFGSQSAFKENVAKVENQNLEVSVTGRAIENQNMRVVFSYNMTMSDNKVKELGENITSYQIVPGYPLAAIWEKKVLGFRDDNNDGILSHEEIILSDSNAYLGWTQPRFRIGYGISATFRNQLVFDSRFAYQSQYAKRLSQGLNYGGEDVTAPIADQALYHMNQYQDNRNISDMRWNSASITYHLPQSLLTKLSGRSVSIALQASNLALWTNYKGKDPSINTSLFSSDVFRSLTPYGEGYADSGSAPPPPRRFVLDFKIGL